MSHVLLRSRPGFGSSCAFRFSWRICVIGRPAFSNGRPAAWETSLWGQEPTSSYFKISLFYFPNRLGVGVRALLMDVRRAIDIPRTQPGPDWSFVPLREIAAHNTRSRFDFSHHVAIVVDTHRCKNIRKKPELCDVVGFRRSETNFFAFRRGVRRCGTARSLSVWAVVVGQSALCYALPCSTRGFCWPCGRRSLRRCCCRWRVGTSWDGLNEVMSAWAGVRG